MNVATWPSLIVLHYNSFVASTSDFWWDHVRRVSFAASVANFMVNHYQFKNGLCLTMSSTTMKKLKSTKKTTKILRSSTPTIKRCQSLLDVSQFDRPKKWQNIGVCLDNIHVDAGCNASYIGSHIFTGASNTGASFEELQWQTSGDRSQKIIAGKNISHKGSNTAN